MGHKARTRLVDFGVSQPLVVGPRVLARHVRVGDSEAFLDMVEASRALFGQWVDPPATFEAFARYVIRMGSVDASSYLIVRRSDAALVGVFNISEIVRGPLQSGYLGYYANQLHAGCGYMSEGLLLVLEHGFQRLKLHRVEANIQPDNARSRALVQRCGFRLEGFSPRYLQIRGRWCDHERWAINFEDWSQRRRSRPA